MDTARDLACADVWQASLERSLARRGKATRSSLELFHLQPERDLGRGDLLRESAMYSQLRRSAASRRPTMMTLPSAGGISALALLAATTLPGLLGGRGSSVRTARITYKADDHGAGSPKTKIAEASVAAPASAARPATATLAAAGATTVPTYATEPHPALAAVHASRPAPARPGTRDRHDRARSGFNRPHRGGRRRHRRCGERRGLGERWRGAGGSAQRGGGEHADGAQGAFDAGGASNLDRPQNFVDRAPCRAVGAPRIDSRAARPGRGEDDTRPHRRRHDRGHHLRRPSAPDHHGTPP